MFVNGFRIGQDELCLLLDDTVFRANKIFVMSVDLSLITTCLQICIGAGNILFKFITAKVPTFMKSFVSESRLCLGLNDDKGAK